jgi:hypothetical protein
MRAIPGGPPMAARLARALALDSNPLRRASDRAEAWIRAGLLALFVITALITAQAAGGWVLQTATPERGSGTAPGHAVHAVLLQPVPAVHAGPAPGPAAQVPVRARWHTPGAPARTGQVLAPRGSPAGSLVTIWVDPSGQLTTSPPEPGPPGHQTTIPLILILAAEALALLAVLRLFQHLLNRHRLAAWEAAWSATEPRWTGHWP